MDSDTRDVFTTGTTQLRKASDIRLHERQLQESFRAEQVEATSLARQPNAPINDAWEYNAHIHDATPNKQGPRVLVMGMTRLLIRAKRGGYASLARQAKRSRCPWRCNF